MGPNPIVDNPTRNRYFDISKFFPIRGKRMRLEFKLEAYSVTSSFMASNPRQYTFRLHF